MITTLTELVANTRHLEELHLKKIECIKQLTYHAALKLNGTSHEHVARIVREVVMRVRKVVDGKPHFELADRIDWSTGNVKPGNQFSHIETGRIVGVVLNDGKVIKFECPIDGWRGKS